MSKRWAVMERFEIPDFDRPEINYLVRLRIIATPLFSIYLHRLRTPDSRPTLHDHPWCFFGVILRGGYDEIRLNKHTMQTYRRRIRFINLMRRDDAHYIEKLYRTPTWSLLFVGTRRRTWGYWRPVFNGHLENGPSWSTPNRIETEFFDSPKPQWYWTPFDQDVHSEEFDRALEARK